LGVARWLLLEIARLIGVVGPKSGRRAVCRSGAPVEPQATASGSRTAAHGAWGGRTMLHNESLHVRPGRGAVASAARGRRDVLGGGTVLGWGMGGYFSLLIT